MWIFIEMLLDIALRGSPYAKRIEKLKRQIFITIYKLMIVIKTKTFTSSLTHNLDFSSRPWRLGWGVRTGRVTA